MNDLTCKSSVILDLLDTIGLITLRVTGSSMRPLLRDNIDCVVIKKYTSGSIKVGDIAFYTRQDGTVVLHRIIKKCNDGTLIACGDSQIAKERVQDNQISGTVISVIKNGKDYKLSSIVMNIYWMIWKYTRRIRPLLHILYSNFIRSKQS